MRSGRLDFILGRTKQQTGTPTNQFPTQLLQNCQKTLLFSSKRGPRSLLNPHNVQTLTKMVKKVMTQATSQQLLTLLENPRKK